MRPTCISHDGTVLRGETANSRRVETASVRRHPFPLRGEASGTRGLELLASGLQINLSQLEQPRCSATSR